MGEVLTISKDTQTKSKTDSVESFTDKVYSAHKSLDYLVKVPLLTGV